MTVVSSPTRALLTLFALKGIGPAALKKVAALPAFWEQSLEDLCEAVPQVAKSADGGSSGAVWQKAKDRADEQIAAAEKHDARIISPIDDEYPKLLAATKDDPFLLFVKGSLAKSQQQSVAIIGTREPTQHGQLIARRITQFFVEQRWSVVSGLAIGCDATAHETTIEAGGHTVAVLAHGLHMIAPSRHKRLAQDILEAGGALVSEYSFGTNVLGAQFVKRDRTQAGLSLGVVMIQSDIQGGSLHASRAALDYKRWLAVPYPTDRDRENGEPKVQANIVIAEGTDLERADILRCPISSLHLVRVVRGREDYLRLIEPDGEKAGVSAPILPNRDALSIEEMPEPPAESQRASVTLGSTSPAGPSPVVEPHAELALERGPHAEELAPLFGATRSDDGPAAQAQAFTTYYLEVGPEDLANLKITQLSPGREESVLGVRSGNNDVDVVLALSRLDHLQVRLDELRKILTSKRLIDSQRASQYRFQIEDVLTHMKRATDELFHLDHGVHSQGLRSIMLRHGAAAGQPELPLLRATAGQLRDAPLADVLDRLVDTLPRSVSPYDHERGRDPSAGEFRTMVHLGDLVCSFNELVKAVLVAQHSHQSGMTMDG